MPVFLYPALGALTQPFRRAIKALHTSPETKILLLAIAVGGSTGLSIVAFHYLYQSIYRFSHGPLSGALSMWGYWTYACLPVLGGLLVGLMRWHWEEFGPGIASLVADSRQTLTPSPVRPLRTIPKLIAASVSLGSGASLGPEGPSVEIGANLGTLIAQRLRVSQERLNLMLGAGAAAGLAAGFNAPIAGVFFALEVVLGSTLATSSVSVVLLSAVVAALVTQMGLGAQPAFALPAYEVRSPLELPLYLGLGAIASVVSLAFRQAIQLAQASFRGEVQALVWLKRVPRPFHPVLAGAVVGLVALQLPPVLGVGYETLEAILRDSPFSLQLLLGLLGVKLVLTALCMGGGFVGGAFAPAMYLGACLGALYGKLMALWLAAVLPGVAIAAPPAYAMVGMAAVLAGSARAPLTAVLLLFELTRDYRIVLPLMAAAGLSVWLLDQITALPTAPAPQPIGVEIPQEQHREDWQRLTVHEAMGKPMAILPGSLTVLQAGQRLLSEHWRWALIADGDNRVVGAVTLKDVNRVLSRTQASDELAHTAQQPIATAFAGEVVYAQQTESVAEAIARLSARGVHQLPVLCEGVALEDRVMTSQIVGVIDRESVDWALGVTLAQVALKPHLLVSGDEESDGVPGQLAEQLAEQLSERIAEQLPEAVSKPRGIQSLSPEPSPLEASTTSALTPDGGAATPVAHEPLGTDASVTSPLAEQVPVETVVSPVLESLGQPYGELDVPLDIIQRDAIQRDAIQRDVKRAAEHSIEQSIERPLERFLDFSPEFPPELPRELSAGPTLEQPPMRLTEVASEAVG